MRRVPYDRRQWQMRATAAGYAPPLDSSLYVKFGNAGTAVLRVPRPGSYRAQISRAHGRWLKAQRS